jgi:hypothetical protein
MGIERTPLHQRQDHQSDDRGVKESSKRLRETHGSLRQAPGPSSGHLPGSIALTRDNLLYLQRTVGNRAVNRLIMTKLQISTPGDEYEREADKVAARAMTKPDAASESAHRITPLPPSEETIQGKQDSTINGDHQIEARLNDNGGGRPLPDGVRAFMEPHFGADFSRVRFAS